MPTFADEKVAMTTPVTTKVVPSSGPNGETVFTRSFYIPYDRQEDAPEPSSADVFLVDEPQMDVYVRYKLKHFYSYFRTIVPY